MKSSKEKSSQEILARVKEIEQLTTDFCKENLTDEYTQLCVKLINKVLALSPDTLMKGRANTIAAGIIQVIAANNFLFRSTTHPVNAEKIAKALGLSAQTISNKSAVIRKAAKVMRDYDPAYATDEAGENNMLVGIRNRFGAYSDSPSSPSEILALLRWF